MVISTRLSYPELLSAVWEDAIAPREPDAPTVISTFAGGGGSTTGYKMAGFHELLAVEWDDNAVQTLRLNYPELAIYHGDIAKLSVEETLERTGLARGRLDVLDGSPPCQGFSTAGRRLLDDPRNQLFREYVRLLRGLQPKVFVMENVSGMVKGKMKLVFVEILKELKASGYNVSARLLNAMYFSVPQSRERMIFIGVREDLKTKPSYPRAQTLKPITLRQALEGVVNTEDELKDSRYKDGLRSSQLLAQLKPWEQGSKVTGGSHFGLKRLDFSRPSGTVLKQDGSGASCSCCHPYELRRLTIRELKRVGSLPDSYQLVGKYAQQWERIGNSVPPLMMRAIALQIKQDLLKAR